MKRILLVLSLTVLITSSSALAADWDVFPVPADPGEGKTLDQGYFGDHPAVSVICPTGNVAVLSSLTFHRSGDY